MTDQEIAACIWAEGFEPLPYKDSKGIWSCGIGYNLEAHGIPASWVKPILDGYEIIKSPGYKMLKMKPGITKSQAVEELETWWHRAASTALGPFFTVWGSFSDVQRFVVTDMVFNMGLGSVKPAKGFLSFSTSTIPAMRRGDWKTVIANLKKSKWAKDTGRRARRDIRMLELGRWLSDEELRTI